MKLKVIGSSSKGNSYLLDNGKECLAIECGIAFREVQKAVDFDISRIVGAVVSHEHGDHAKYARKFIEAQIPVYASHGTFERLKLNNSHLIHPMDERSINVIGNFRVQPFKVQHDAAEPFGFLIHHPETGVVLFATDTYYLRYKFAGLNNILIECNYRQDILDANCEAGEIPEKLRERTMQSHCSYETCREILLANNLSEVNNIVLIHLSGRNSDASAFRKGIAVLTGKTVYVAKPGLVIDYFNKSPF